MIKGWGVVKYVEDTPAEKSSYHPPSSTPVPDEDIHKKSCKRLTPEQHNAIVKDPRPIRVIAKEYDVTPNRIYKIIRRSEIPGVQELHKKKRRFTDDQIRAIRADKRKQKTIAAEYGIVQGTVWAIKRRKIYRDVQELRNDRI